MKKLPYFPGCTLHTSSKEYNMSAKKVCRRLGITLSEIYPMFSTDWINYVFL